MRSTILAGVLVVTTGLTGLWAQKVKSQAEQDAIVAMQKATDADTMIKAAQDLVTKFTDSDYREFAYMMEARAYQQKGPGSNADAEIAALEALKINPKSYLMEILVGETTVQGMKDHDIDRDDKVARATKMFKGAIDDVTAAAKPNPTLADDVWAQQKSYIVAEAHNGLGMLAQADAGLKKDGKPVDDSQAKWEVAIKEFQAASAGDPEQDAYATRLANAYLGANKPDQALEVCNKLLAKADLHPQIKNVVNSIKNNAEAAKKNADTAKGAK